MIKEVIILHDVDGRIYFDGIKHLLENGEINEIKYYESIVIKRLLKKYYTVICLLEILKHL